VEGKERRSWAIEIPITNFLWKALPQGSAQRILKAWFKLEPSQIGCSTREEIAFIWLLLLE
jgi:hypothetical protein